MRYEVVDGVTTGSSNSEREISFVSQIIWSYNMRCVLNGYDVLSPLSTLGDRKEGTVMSCVYYKSTRVFEL
jgi:hypothetical protein